MTKEEKIFSAQKYFIFKLSDILNNSYHCFEEKRMESLKFLLGLCIDTYEEINSATIGNDKLEKSFKSLLGSLSFQIERHPFHYLSIYTKDFKRLENSINNISKINDDNGKSGSSKQIVYELYMSMNSLKKKLNLFTLSEQYCECLQSFPLSFQEVDNLIEAFISDLLYTNGYSINYLNEWHTETLITSPDLYEAIENKDLSSQIEKIKTLNGTLQSYQVIIPYQVKSVSQQDIAQNLLSKHFRIEDKKSLSETLSEITWTEETFACKNCQATDKYKAIQIAMKEFEASQDLFSIWQNTSPQTMRFNINIGIIPNDEGFEIINYTRISNTKLISYFDKTRVSHLNTFINLKDTDNSDIDIDTLERILRTLHTAKNYNIQNRFLNFWSAIEYCIYPFPKNSIIEKARVVVSESFSLFYVKNKMKIFWERINYFAKSRKSTSYPYCVEFIDYCKTEPTEDYDFVTTKMIEYLQTESLYDKLLEELKEPQIVLHRELMELIMLVTDSKKLKSAIDEYHNGIIHDLDCIYRLRNQLIHSAKSMDDSLEHISLRLYKYVNSIIATVLYYKNINPNITIVEILNSLHNTYDVYIDILSGYAKDKHQLSPEEAYSLVRPKYLFIE